MSNEGVDSVTVRWDARRRGAAKPRYFREGIGIEKYAPGRRARTRARTLLTMLLVLFAGAGTVAGLLLLAVAVIDRLWGTEVARIMQGMGI